MRFNSGFKGLNSSCIYVYFVFRRSRVKTENRGWPPLSNISDSTYSFTSLSFPIAFIWTFLSSYYFFRLCHPQFLIEAFINFLYLLLFCCELVCCVVFFLSPVSEVLHVACTNFCTRIFSLGPVFPAVTFLCLCRYFVSSETRV